eukprot:TRINITY_DN13470_c0_g1_i1.p1 TRINITY_DN13470_c0_g1~~TRINITY_DN13470_c0_g1_i1.p1  ORF type:complete len:1404 (-),score=192.45 TRINITY_DN13470_c0_g1_i1:94-4305(-)
MTYFRKGRCCASSCAAKLRSSGALSKQTYSITLAIAVAFACVPDVDAHVDSTSDAHATGRRAERRFFRADASERTVVDVNASALQGNEQPLASLAQGQEVLANQQQQQQSEDTRLLASVRPGTWLFARDRSDVFETPYSWQKIGEVAAGGTVLATGPPVYFQGYYMVPVDPMGAVQYGSNAFVFMEGVRDGTALVAQEATPVYMSTESWEVIGSVPAGTSVYAAAFPVAIDNSVKVSLRPYGAVQLGSRAFSVAPKPMATLRPVAPVVVQPEGDTHELSPVASAHIGRGEKSNRRSTEARVALSLVGKESKSDADAHAEDRRFGDKDEHRGGGDRIADGELSSSAASAIAAQWEEAQGRKASVTARRAGGEVSALPLLRPSRNIFRGLLNVAAVKSGASVFASGSAAPGCASSGTSRECFGSINDGIYGNKSEWSPGLIGYNSGLFAGVKFKETKWLKGVRIHFVNRTQKSANGEAVVQITNAAHVNHATSPKLWESLGRISIRAAGRGFFRFNATPPIVATGLRVVVDNSHAIIDEIEVYGRKTFSGSGPSNFAKMKNVALREAGGIPFGSGSLKGKCKNALAGEGSDFCGEGEGCFCNINDGLFANVGSMWMPNVDATPDIESNKRFVGVRFPMQWISGIRISRMGNTSRAAIVDRSAYCCRDGYKGTYLAQISVIPNSSALTGDNAWRTLGSFTRESEHNVYFRFGLPINAKTDAVRIVVTDPDSIIDEIAVYGGKPFISSLSGVDVRKFPNVAHREALALPFGSSSKSSGCDVTGLAIGFFALGRSCFNNINDGVFSRRSSWAPRGHKSDSMEDDSMEANDNQSIVSRIPDMDPFFGVRLAKVNKIVGLRIYAEGQVSAGPPAPLVSGEEPELLGEDEDFWAKGLEKLEPQDNDPVMSRERVAVANCSSETGDESGDPAECERVFDKDFEKGWSSKVNPSGGSPENNSWIRMMLNETSPVCGVHLVSGNSKNIGRLNEFKVLLAKGDKLVSPKELVLLDGAEEGEIIENRVKVRGQSHVHLSFEPELGVTAVKIQVLRTDSPDGNFSIREIRIEKDPDKQPLQKNLGQAAHNDATCTSEALSTSSGSASFCYTECANVEMCNYFYAVTSGEGPCLLYNSCEGLNTSSDYANGVVFEMEDSSQQRTLLRGEQNVTTSANKGRGEADLTPTHLDLKTMASEGMLHAGVELDLEVKCKDVRNCLTAIVVSNDNGEGLEIPVSMDIQDTYKTDQWSRVNIPIDDSHYKTKNSFIEWPNMTRLAACSLYGDDPADFQIRDVRLQRNRPEPPAIAAPNLTSQRVVGEYTIRVTATNRSDPHRAPKEAWDVIGVVPFDTAKEGGGEGGSYLELAQAVPAHAVRVDVRVFDPEDNSTTRRSHGLRITELEVFGAPINMNDPFALEEI